MRVLFVHRAFPAQFGRLALELSRRYGWQCSFLIEHLSRCPTPTPEMLAALPLHYLRPPEGTGKEVPWPQQFGEALAWGERLAAAARELKTVPDLVVGHGGLLPTLFLKDVWDCPIIDFCEYNFAVSGRDLTYRRDLPFVEPALFFPRCINAATLINFLACNAAYCPTEWQRRSFPQRFWKRIEVFPDGIDTELYRPRRLPRRLGGRALAAGTRVVTFAARGLESVRGFDLFVRIAAALARRHPDILFVVAGDEAAYYGWDKLFAVGTSFKESALEKAGTDRSRFLFLGQVEPEQLADVFALTDLHLYLSVPFVSSWSLLNALSSGCIVLAPDDEPVREFIEPGRNGLLAPLFDTDRWVEVAAAVLDDPAAYFPLGEAARQTMLARYHFDHTIPPLADFFEKAAGAGVNRSVS